MIEDGTEVDRIEATLAWQARHDLPMLICWGVQDGQCTCGSLYCTSQGKHPIGLLCPQGVHDATRDTEQLREWLTKYPRANLALATGEASGITVADIDGEAGLAAIRAWSPDGRGVDGLRSHPQVRTPGGGVHVYFSKVPGLGDRQRVGGASVDAKSAGYVLCPPSTGLTGEYRWVPMTGAILRGRNHPAGPLLTPEALRPMPDWLLACVTAPKVVPVVAVPEPEPPKRKLRRESMEAESPLEKLARHHPELNRPGRQKSDGSQTWRICSPVRTDNRPSLDITETTDGTILVKDWAPDRSQAQLIIDLCEHWGVAESELFARGQRRRSAARHSGPAAPDHVPDSSIEQWTAVCYHAHEVGRASYPALQDELGLSMSLDAMDDLLIGRYPYYGRRTWGYPERDGVGRIVGAMLRLPDRKRAVTSDSTDQALPLSRRGLIMPVSLIDPPASVMNQPLFCPEGMSDVLALLSIDIPAIGRASADVARNTTAWLAAYLTRTSWHEVWIVGDNDAGAGHRGAIETARALATRLRREIVAVRPPVGVKDAREMINRGLPTDFTILRRYRPEELTR